MIESLLLALWFFLPAGVANAAPVLSNKIPVLSKWKTPMDFGLSWHGRRLLGDNKTWRGFLFGVLLAVGTAWLLYAVWQANLPPIGTTGGTFWSEIGTLAKYHTADRHVLMIGALLGAGALLGDAVESFFKRQRGVGAGQRWFPFDQIDYIVGGLVLVAPLTRLTPTGYLAVAVVWFGMHLLFAYIAFLLGLKKSPI